MYNNKAQSDVVSTVLIILLVVAAVAIIGAIILNVVNRGGASVSNTALCNNVVLKPTSCVYNNTNTFGLFSTNINGNTTLVNATLTLYNKQGDTVIKVVPGANIGNLQTNSFLLTKDNTVDPSSKLSIYAVIKSNDGTTAICPSSVSIPCTIATISGVGQINGANTSTFVNNGNGNQLSQNNQSNQQGNGGVGVQYTTVSINACGTLSQINTIYKLTGNLQSQPSSDCFDIRANNITLDGQGHSISGANANGVDARNGLSNIVVSNLQVSGYIGDIVFISVTNGTVNGNNLSGSGASGLSIVGGGSSNVFSNGISGPASGIQLSSSNYNSFSGNFLSLTHYGFDLASSSNNVAASNTYSGNTQNFFNDSNSHNNTGF